jgi:hypothetical protein
VHRRQLASSVVAVTAASTSNSRRSPRMRIIRSRSPQLAATQMESVWRLAPSDKKYLSKNASGAIISAAGRHCTQGPPSIRAHRSHFRSDARIDRRAMARAGAQAAAEDAASLTMIDIPRGKYIGRRVVGSPKDEAEHFYQCEACGGWVDRRDLAQVSSRKDRCRVRRRISRNDHGCRRPNRRILNASGSMPPT